MTFKRRCLIIFYYNNVNHIAVCEEVCNERNIFDDDVSLVSHIQGPEDARTFANGAEDVAKLEERLKLWMKRVHEVINSLKLLLNIN
jgi:hypothetical protein